MNTLRRYTPLAALLVGLLFAPAVGAQAVRDERPRLVRDEIGLFSSAAIRQANEDVAHLKSKYHKDLLIETVKEGPKDAKFGRWAEERAEERRINGLYVVITEKPRRHLEVVVGNKTRQSGRFTQQDAKELSRLMLSRLKKEGKKDAALTAGTQFVLDTFRQNAPPVKGTTTGAAAPAPRSGGLFSGWLPWICVGIAGLLVVWLIFGMIRGLSGGGGGYAAGGGGYGSPGFGGFFPSLIGGLFGAAAGMWMYNHFFGGGNVASAAPPSTDASAAEPADTDYSSTGGDYDGGDADADGDAGGDAGGDWGGGGDTGGGDFGGDFGGDAGGDW